MSHLTGSPSHELDRTSAQEVVNQAEISQEWVEDEIVPEVEDSIAAARGEAQGVLAVLLR